MRHSRSRGPRPIRAFFRLVGLLIFVAGATWIWAPRSRVNEVRDPESLDRDLRGAASVTPREGIAAVVLIDVSGSMQDTVEQNGAELPKIAVARSAALDLVRQFDEYAKAHAEEPVLVGLFEFSARQGAASTREVIPLSAPDLERARTALAAMRANGGTPIGDALVAGKRALDAAALTRRHLLVVTDGANTDGYDPADVLTALNRRPDNERPSVYFVAFDIEKSRFNAVRDAGALVLAAANGQELNATLNALLTGKILVEGP